MANNEMTNRQQSQKQSGMTNRQQQSNLGPLTLRDAMNRLFQDSFVWPSGFFSNDAFGMLNSMPMDMYETDNDVVVKTVLPGVKPENANIQVQNNELVIDADIPEQTMEDARFHYREMVSGHYHREIPLPENVDTNKVEATMENGLLTVCMPKSELSKPKKIQVKAHNK